MGYSLLIGAIAVLLLPLVAAAALPIKAARAFLGLVLFVIGTLIVDHVTATVLPYDDDSPGDMVAPLIIAVLIGIGLFSTLLLAARDTNLFAPEQDEGGPRLDWARAAPLGAFVAVVFMHWLRNRLAGAEPALSTHGAVILVFLVLLSLAGWSVWKGRGRQGLINRPLLAFAATGIVLTCANIEMGFRMWDRSRELAEGRPFCVMTYGGFEKERVAESGWDLSPLVNRRYAVWAVSKAPVVSIQEESGTKSFRYFAGQWRDVTRWNGGTTQGCSPR